METSETQVKRKQEGHKKSHLPNLVKCNSTADDASEIDHKRKPSTQKTSRFSLSKIGRAHTFSIRKKSKDKDIDISSSRGKMKTSDGFANYEGVDRSRSKTSDRHRNHEDIFSSSSSSHRAERSPSSHKSDRRRGSSPCQTYVGSSSKDSSSSPASHKTERHRVSSSGQSYVGSNSKDPTRMVDDKSVRNKPSHGHGQERHGHSRKHDPKRADRPDQRYHPLRLENPPKILIQDFSSEYTDDMTFDDEYFELVEWAFQVLRLQCHFCIEPQFKDVEPKGGQKGDGLQVITNETARVGTTLDYIIHPITTGAANVIQTGAKLADFTSRIWKGIHIDSFGSKRNQNSKSDKS